MPLYQTVVIHLVIQQDTTQLAQNERRDALVAQQYSNLSPEMMNKNKKFLAWLVGFIDA